MQNSPVTTRKRHWISFWSGFLRACVRYFNAYCQSLPSSVKSCCFKFCHYDFKWSIRKVSRGFFFSITLYFCAIQHCKSTVYGLNCFSFIETKYTIIHKIYSFLQYLFHHTKPTSSYPNFITHLSHHQTNMLQKYYNN